MSYALADGEALPGADVVVRNISRLVATIENLLAEHEVNLKEAPDKWVSKALAAPSPSRAVSKALYGSITNHPAWAAAYVERPDDLVFMHLQATYLAAYLLDPVRLSLGSCVSTTRVAGLYIRKMAAGNSQLSRLSSDLAELSPTLDGMKLALNGFAETIGQPNHPAGLCARAIARHIEYAFGSREPDKRKLELQRVAKGTLSEHESGDVEGISEVFYPPLNNRIAKAREIAAAAPQSEFTGPSIITVASDIKPTLRDDIRYEFYRAREKGRSLRSAGQMLPYGSSRLQLPDLQVLLSWIGESTRQGTPVRQVQPEITLRAVAALSLLAGKDTEVVLATKVAKDLSDGIQALSNSDCRIVLSLGPAGILMPAPALRNRFIPTEEETTSYQQTVPFLFLPLCLDFPGVKVVLEMARDRAGQSLFGSDQQPLEVGLNKQLSELNNRSGARLTSIRVGSFLSLFITDMQQDRADGTFFSRRNLTYDRSARLFYYGPMLHDLVNKYRKAIEAILKHAGAATHRSKTTGARNVNWSWLTLPKEFAGHRVGSAGVADMTLVSKAFAQIRSTNRARRPDIRSRSQLVRFHNHYTAYTVLIVLWTTGIRAVQDPIEIDLLDLDQGFLGVSDKDSDEYPNARVVCLSQPARKQLAFYNQHRAVLLSKRVNLRLKEEPETWLFFVNERKAEPVRPSALLHHLGTDFQFRACAQRHFIRTVLRERGVAGADIDALLGHGAVGEEAYGAYSCYSPAKLKRNLAPVLDRLANDLNIQPIRGLSLRVRRKRSAS